MSSKTGVHTTTEPAYVEATAPNTETEQCANCRYFIDDANGMMAGGCARLSHRVNPLLKRSTAVVQVVCTSAEVK